MHNFTNWVTYPRLEPVVKLDDVRVMKALQHCKFIINHLLIAFDILFQNNFHRDLSRGRICFANNSIGPSTKCPSETILRSKTV